MCDAGLHRVIAGCFMLLTLGCQRDTPGVVSLLSMTNAWQVAKGERAVFHESARKVAAKMDAFRCQKLMEILHHPYSQGDVWAIIEYERLYHSNSYIIYVLTKTACYEYRFAKNWRTINRVKIEDRSEERAIVQRECIALYNFKHLARQTRERCAYERPLICVFVTLYKDRKPVDMFFSFYPTCWDQRYCSEKYTTRHAQAYYTVLECLEHAARECVVLEKTGDPYPGE